LTFKKALKHSTFFNATLKFYRKSVQFKSIPYILLKVKRLAEKKSANFHFQRFDHKTAPEKPIFGNFDGRVFHRFARAKKFIKNSLLKGRH